jgi:hypothetical protein
MKRTLILFLIFSFLVTIASPALAYRRGQSPRYGNYSQDSHGHWTSNGNLWNDSDGDGVVNYYDSSDRNPNKY